jgi:hypothetical protein
MMKRAREAQKEPTSIENTELLIESMADFFRPPIDKSILAELDNTQLTQLISFLYGSAPKAEEKAEEKNAPCQP